MAIAEKKRSEYNSRIRIKTKEVDMRRERLGRKQRIILMGLLLVILASVIVLTAITCSCREDYTLYEAEEVTRYTANNEYSTDEQKAFVEAALSLVGKVRYFWGGKSSAIGWDEEWGQPKFVESSGSSTTGTMQTFGLDCSGYVSWCFIQTGVTPQEMSRSIGEGTWNQWDKASATEKTNVQLGDLAFINRYPGATGNHVGIVVGFTDSGEPLIAHCSPTYNDVVVSNCGGQFIYFRRPAFLVTEG